MGNIASRASGGANSNLTVSDDEVVETGHHAAEERQSMRLAATEAPTFMRSVSNAQVTVGPVTVAGRDSISSTIIQYFPSSPQDPGSGERSLTQSPLHSSQSHSSHFQKLKLRRSWTGFPLLTFDPYCSIT